MKKILVPAVVLAKRLSMEASEVDADGRDRLVLKRVGVRR